MLEKIRTQKLAEACSRVKWVNRSQRSLMRMIWRYQLVLSERFHKRIKFFQNTQPCDQIQPAFGSDVLKFRTINKEISMDRFSEKFCRLADQGSRAEPTGALQPNSFQSSAGQRRYDTQPVSRIGRFFSQVGSSLNHLVDRRPVEVRMGERTARLDTAMHDVLVALANNSIDSACWNTLEKAADNHGRIARSQFRGNQPDGDAVVQYSASVRYAFQRQMPLPGDHPDLVMKKMTAVLAALASKQACTAMQPGLSGHREMLRGELLREMAGIAEAAFAEQLARPEIANNGDVQMLMQCASSLFEMETARVDNENEYADWTRIDLEKAATKNHLVAEAKIVATRLAVSDLMECLQFPLIGDEQSGAEVISRFSGYSKYLDPEIFEEELKKTLQILDEKDLAKLIVFMAQHTTLSKKLDTEAEFLLRKVIDIASAGYAEKYPGEEAIIGIKGKRFDQLTALAKVLAQVPVLKAHLDRLEKQIAETLFDRAKEEFKSLWLGQGNVKFSIVLAQLSYIYDMAADKKKGNTLLRQLFRAHFEGKSIDEMHSLIVQLEKKLMVRKQGLGNHPEVFLDAATLLTEANQAKNDLLETSGSLS